MVDQDRVLELLAEWEECRQNGQTPTATDLCPDDALLRAELQARIEKRLRIEAVLQPPTLGVHEVTPRVAPLPTIAGYEILSVLGHGGMGVVYKARQAGLNRIVALKMILAGPAAVGDELARFRIEAESVARLQHPNIVQVYEVGDDGGRPYLALEYLDGGSLSQQLDGTPLPPRKAAEILLTLARAVEHAHQHGVIHRDLKPANILLASHRRKPALTPDSKEPSGATRLQLGEFTLKIADFGLAKHLDGNPSHTQTGTVLGTPSYMAPEQAAGKTRDIGPATDIYALGVMLYELLTGRPPFVGRSILETLEQVRNHDPIAPSLVQPKLPRDLEVICLKCLEKKPEHRYPSAAKLAADLQAFLEGEPVSARDFTMLSQMTRVISHTDFSERFGSWSTLMLVLAPLVFLVSAVLYLLCRHRPDFPYIISFTTMGTLIFIQTVLFFGNRASLRQVPSRQRRHMWTVWVTNAIGSVLALFIVWYVTPADHPEQLFIVYPIWMMLVGVAYFGFASDIGFHYVVGAMCFLGAVLAVFVLPWAPLLLAAFASTNMTVQGLLLRTLKPDNEPLPPM